VGTMAVKSALGNSWVSRRSMGVVPSSRDRTRTLTPAMWLRGRRRDQTCPNFAPRNSLDALAEARRALAVIPTSLDPPVVPLVAMTKATGRGTWSDVIAPKPKAGPVPTKAAANSTITFGMGLSAGQRSSLCDEFSIATVG